MGKNVSKDIYSAVRRATSHLAKSKTGEPDSKGTDVGEEFKVILNGKAE